MSSNALPHMAWIETSQSLGGVLRRAASKKPATELDGDTDNESSPYLPCPPSMTSPEASFSNMRSAFRQYQRSSNSTMLQVKEVLEQQRKVGRPGATVSLPPISGATPAPPIPTMEDASLDAPGQDKQSFEDNAPWLRECQAFEPKEPVCEPTMAEVPKPRSRYQSLLSRRENSMMRHTFDTSVLDKATSQLPLDDNDTSMDAALDMTTTDEKPKQYVRAATFNVTFDVFGDSAELEREAYEAQRSRAAQAKSEATLPLWQSCRSSTPLGDESSESDAASAESDMPAHDEDDASMSIRAETPPETPPARQMSEGLKQSRLRMMRSQLR